MDRQAKEYLKAAGIGARYHDQTLDNHPLVIDFIECGSLNPVAAGEKGLMMVGAQPAREACILIARWFAMSGKSILVTSSLNLARLLHEPDEEEEVRLKGRLVVVTDIQHDKECPLGSWQKAMVADFVRWRVEDGSSIILVSTQKELDWWDEGFRDFVNRHFVVLEYHG